MSTIDAFARQDRRKISSGSEDAHGILIVDPQPDHMRVLASGLESYGFGTTTCIPAEWGNHLRARLAAVVVGPNLSPRETWKLCKDVRISLQTPLVVVSSSAEPDHLSLAMDSGADYCFPCHPDAAARVILAALHALERRERLARADNLEVIEAGHLKIDLQRKIAEVHGKRVPLTVTEFGILGVLARQPGHVISAASILRDVQGYEADEAMAQDIVKVHISRLRQKLEAPGVAPSIINVRGQGYMYMFERRAAQAG
jgi:DNA-binding response OmpR family regulator